MIRQPETNVEEVSVIVNSFTQNNSIVYLPTSVRTSEILGQVLGRLPRLTVLGLDDLLTKEGMVLASLLVVLVVSSDKKRE